MTGFVADDHGQVVSPGGGVIEALGVEVTGVEVDGAGALLVVAGLVGFVGSVEVLQRAALDRRHHDIAEVGRDGGVNQRSGLA